MCAEIGLGEADGKRRVGRQIELWITFSPVPRSRQRPICVVRTFLSELDDRDIDGRGRASTVDLLF